MNSITFVVISKIVNRIIKKRRKALENEYPGINLVVFKEAGGCLSPSRIPGLREAGWLPSHEPQMDVPIKVLKKAPAKRGRPRKTPIGRHKSLIAQPPERACAKRVPKTPETMELHVDTKPASEKCVEMMAVAVEDVDWLADQLKPIVVEMKRHSMSGPFHQPVNASEAPGYYKIIPFPIGERRGCHEAFHGISLSFSQT